MADKHPYTSGIGNIAKAIRQFRISLPARIDTSVLKKLGIAPNNESYIINILRFVNIIDNEGNSTPEARKVFVQHDDAIFGKQFAEMIKKAYSELFSLHIDNTWELDTDALISYFRQTDQTSSVVGKLQANTFQSLAAFAGHGEAPTPRTSPTRKEKVAKKKPKPKTAEKAGGPPEQHAQEPARNRPADLGLTVRIEINLPVAQDQATYDLIFKSIRENLLNG